MPDKASAAKKTAKKATRKRTDKKRTTKKPHGRPSKRSASVEERIIEGLSIGTPLTQICQADDMPAWRTVYDWMDSDEAFSAAIARAREVGFDRIAMDALAIADGEGADKDTTVISKGGVEIEVPNKEWMLRSKLRVDTRLKLLAKWDPKRYGEKIAQEVSGPDGKPIQQEQSLTITAEDEEAIKRIAASRDKVVSQQPKGE